MPSGEALADTVFAGVLATEAGRLLLAVRQELRGAGEQERKTAGDRRSQELIAEALGRERPGDAILSEEAIDNPARLTARRVWIIDPLDGTREFGELERTDWAVHVALWDRGRLVAGAVALPAQDVTLVAGTVSAGERRPGPPRVVVSRTRPPALAIEVARSLGGELVAMGSAGAKVAAVVRGLVDVYVHAGGQYEWDSAAPVAVALAAGLHASRIDGSALVYNRPDPLLPDLLVCRPELVAPVLAAVSRSRR
jgi:3'(2'), 5'-bisphosphate nucleotidase